MSSDGEYLALLTTYIKDEPIELDDFNHDSLIQQGQIESLRRTKSFDGESLNIVVAETIEDYPATSIEDDCKIKNETFENFVNCDQLKVEINVGENSEDDGDEMKTEVIKEIKSPKLYGRESLRIRVGENMEGHLEEFIEDGNCEIKNELLENFIDYEELKVEILGEYSEDVRDKIKTENNFPDYNLHSEGVQLKEDIDCEMLNEDPLSLSLYLKETQVQTKQSESTMVTAKRCDEMKEENSECRKNFRGAQEASEGASSCSTSGQQERSQLPSSEYNFKDIKDKIKINLSNHSNAERLKCVCSFRANNKKSLKDLSLIHSGTKLFKCSECNFETKYTCYLKQHSLIHSNSKLFKCFDCDFESNQIESLITHLSIHLNVKPVAQGLNPKPIIYNSSSREGGIRRVNNKAELFKCFTCGYETNQKGYFITHLLKHSNLPTQDLNLESSIRNSCILEGGIRRINNEDIRRLNNKQLFKCSGCDYKCNEKGLLKAHLLAHSTTKVFRCSKCGYECNKKSSLKVHILTHSNEKTQKTSYRKRGETKHPDISNSAWFADRGLSFPGKL